MNIVLLFCHVNQQCAGKVYIVCVPLEDQSYGIMMRVKQINLWTNPMGHVQRTNPMGHVQRTILMVHVQRTILMVHVQRTILMVHVQRTILMVHVQRTILMVHVQRINPMGT